MGLAVVIVVAVFVYWAKDALVDSDGDGLLNYVDEYPTQYNFPATDYAEEKSLSKEILEDLACLDSDFELDENEIVFIDYVSTFDEELQHKIIQSFLADEMVSSEEKTQIRFLNTFTREEQVQMIENGTCANSDWDGDNMNNYFEKVIAFLPWDVYNGRYAIVVNTMGENDTSGDSLTSFLIEEQNFEPSNVIKLVNDNATKANFIQAVSKIAQLSDEKDIVCIFYDGHGGKEHVCFRDENMDHTDMAKEIGTIKYGKMLITVSSCGKDAPIVPLSSGHSQRIVSDIDSCWIYSLSNKYVRTGGIPDSKLFDLNGDNYVSFDEILKTQVTHRLLGNDARSMSDKDGIAPTFYFGDAEVKSIFDLGGYLYGYHFSD